MIPGFGLYHEHQRPDRDIFVTNHCENVRGETIADKTMEGCEAYAKDLAVHSPGVGDSDSPYDVHLLMHYASKDYCDPADCKETITSKTPGESVRGEKPSQGDVKRLCSLYSEVCKGV